MANVEKPIPILIDVADLKIYKNREEAAIDEKLKKFVFTEGEDTPSGDVLPATVDADTLKGHPSEYFASQEGLEAHNVSATAHTDIRELIQTVSTRLNTLADSDDETLDQLSEIVAYIKSNRDLISSVTTTKVNVADIVNHLNSQDENKPLAAKQGNVLFNLIKDLEAKVDAMPKIEVVDNDAGGQTLVIS